MYQQFFSADFKKCCDWMMVPSCHMKSRDHSFEQWRNTVPVGATRCPKRNCNKPPRNQRVEAPSWLMLPSGNHFYWTWPFIVDLKMIIYHTYLLEIRIFIANHQFVWWYTLSSCEMAPCYRHQLGLLTLVSFSVGRDTYLRPEVGTAAVRLQGSCGQLWATGHEGKDPLNPEAGDHK